MTPLERLRRAAGTVRWYARAVVGADAYERYVEHQRRAHPDEPLQSEREFWRARTDERDAKPTMRCC